MVQQPTLVNQSEAQAPAIIHLRKQSPSLMQLMETSEDKLPEEPEEAFPGLVKDPQTLIESV